MNAVTPYQPHQAAGPMSVVELKDRARKIHEIASQVMKKGEHYGTVPGTKKRTLLKAGSEILLSTFRLAVDLDVEDLSKSDDEVRYRVKCRLVHAPTGEFIGAGVGECSSSETKYKWRWASKPEYDNTDDDRRRIKYDRDGETMQVRQNPPDVANTVLKMAKKRAQVDATLTALGVSDLFTQDEGDKEITEDTKPDGRGGPGVSSGTAASASGQSQGSAPSTAGRRDGVATAAQIGLLRKKLAGAQLQEALLCDAFQVEKLDSLPFNQVDAALKWIAEAS